MISFILNIPYTVIGLIFSLVSGVQSIEWDSESPAYIVHIKRFWWAFGYMKSVRAMTIGHVVLLAPNRETLDLEHELVHVKQYQRMPVIFPVLYYLELIRKGYRNNTYEEEAYRVAGNIYKED
jgi:hypothetical protein